MDSDVLMTPDLSSILKFILILILLNFFRLSDWSNIVLSILIPQLVLLFEEAWGKGEHEGKEGWVGRGCREDGWGTERLQRQKDTGWLTGRRKGLKKLSRETSSHRAGEWNLFFTLLIRHTHTHSHTAVEHANYQHTVPLFQENATRDQLIKYTQPFASWWRHDITQVPLFMSRQAVHKHALSSETHTHKSADSHTQIEIRTHTQAQQACPWSFKVYREIYRCRTHSLAHCLLPPQSSSGPPIILSSFASLADTSR